VGFKTHKYFYKSFTLYKLFSYLIWDWSVIEGQTCFYHLKRRLTEEKKMIVSYTPKKRVIPPKKLKIVLKGESSIWSFS
jgi:hypothetical protein